MRHMLFVIGLVALFCSWQWEGEALFWEGRLPTPYRLFWFAAPAFVAFVCLAFAQAGKEIQMLIAKLQAAIAATSAARAEAKAAGAPLAATKAQAVNSDLQDFLRQALDARARAKKVLEITAPLEPKAEAPKPAGPP